MKIIFTKNVPILEDALSTNMHVLIMHQLSILHNSLSMLDIDFVNQFEY